MRRFATHDLCRPLFGSLILVLIVGVAGMGMADEEKSEGCSKNTMTLSPLAKVDKQEFDWGWIAWTMNDQIDPESTMTFGLVYLKPRQTNTFHVHPNADEILHVIEGKLEHRLGKGWVKMGPGDTIRIPKGVPHNARTGEEGCRVVVVYDTGAREFVPVEEESNP
jgi:quercetin dioxygenase-like cupin family protein